MPTTLEHIQYGFDRDRRRTWKRRTLTTNEDDHYSYDALSQVTVAARGNSNLNLTAISGRPVSEQSWDYDPTGNWRGFDAAENGNPILDQHRVHDRGNRLTQIEDSPTAMVLDRAGRMRLAAPDAEGDWNGKLELTWDAWSRVTSVKNNGAPVGEYQYDGLTRRTTREVSGVTWHSYYSDAWRPLEERKNAETTAALSYLWGARHRDDLVRRDRALGGTALNETRYVLMDYFSAAAIADEDGEVKERYAYSAFGVRRIMSPEFTTRQTSECGFEFGFQGQFLDVESGLMNYGYRSYSPYLGRWMCKDPIKERGGINFYGIVGNNAINLVDEFGLYGVGMSPLIGMNPRGPEPGVSDNLGSGPLENEADYWNQRFPGWVAEAKNEAKEAASKAVESKCGQMLGKGVEVSVGYSKQMTPSSDNSRGPIRDFLSHVFRTNYGEDGTDNDYGDRPQDGWEANALYGTVTFGLSAVTLSGPQRKGKQCCYDWSGDLNVIDDLGLSPNDFQDHPVSARLYDALGARGGRNGADRQKRASWSITGTTCC